jgi:protein SCO1/2
MNTKIMKSLLGVVFTAVLLGGYMTYQKTHVSKEIDAASFHGTYLKNPRPVNDFALDRTDAKPFNNESLKGRWTIMFFGFTNCGYLCPTTMAELAKMTRLLEEKNITNLPQIVMVSVDPKRDTIDRLGQYVRSFSPSFYGARGDEEALKAMTTEMGVAYARVESSSPTTEENYDIQHSGALILFNPEGELNAFFTTPHNADLLVKDYMLLIS